MSSGELDLHLILTQLDRIEALLVRHEPASPWLTAFEAAEFLRCSKSKLNQLTADGLLPFKRRDPTLIKSPRLFSRRDLTAFLVTGRNPETNPLSPDERRRVRELL